MGRRRPAARGGDGATRLPGAAVLRRPRRTARPPASRVLGSGATHRKFLTAEKRADVGLSALYTRSSRPEARIDIPRHEWQRDMDRTRRGIDRMLRRKPTRADASAGHTSRGRRDHLMIHG